MKGEQMVALIFVGWALMFYGVMARTSFPLIVGIGFVLMGTSL